LVVHQKETAAAWISQSLPVMRALSIVGTSPAIPQ